MISGTQVRAARAILKLTIVELADLAGIAPNTVVRVEADKSVNLATLKVLQFVFEGLGVLFREDGSVSPPASAPTQATSRRAHLAHAHMGAD